MRILLTGASNPIGADAARHLERRGCSLTKVEADFGDEVALERAIFQVDGELDGAVLGHGVAETGTIEEISSRDFRHTLNHNLISHMIILRAISPRLKRSASVVVVSSTAALDHSVAMGCHYTASKYALNGMVRHLAFEFAERQIRINAVCPGWIEGWGPPKDVEEAAAVAGLPMKRMAKLSEISEVITFLIGPGSTYITGTAIPVSGGFK
jgi:NAD(P)-dependent dehydrogenase (short-subunit alcohol dehydrogenase family)